MKPYYQDDLVTIYHGDARDLVTPVCPLAYDLIVTDPPYGMSYRHGSRKGGPMGFDLHTIIAQGWPDGVRSAHHHW